MPSSPPTLSRRRFLRSAGVAGAVAGVGCLSFGSDEPTYRLHVSSVGDSLGDALRWESPPLYADHNRALLERLLDRGSLETAGFSVHNPLNDHPAYVERDGTYYRIEAERGPEVERERWELWFERVDSAPSEDATVVDHESITDGRSEQDAYALESAFPLTEFGPRDVSDDGPGSRGHLFVRHDPEDTELLPDPPFTHVRLEWDDEDHHFRVRTERVTASLRRIDHSAEAVAESAEAFEAYVEDRHVVATFDGDTDEAVFDILDTPREYEEEPPLSDAFERVIERLGLDDLEVPDHGRVEFSDDVFFARDDGYYEAQLEILN